MPEGDRFNFFRLLHLLTYSTSLPMSPPTSRQPGHNSAYLSTSMLNCFCRLPRYSPIICLLSPLREMRNLATAFGRLSRKRRSIRYRIPFSGFLESTTGHRINGTTSTTTKDVNQNHHQHTSQPQPTSKHLAITDSPTVLAPLITPVGTI